MVQRSLTALPFEELRDSDTGRPRVRMVDVDSQLYQVAREYMIRLAPGDLDDPEIYAKLAAAGMPLDAHAERYRASAAL